MIRTSGSLATLVALLVLVAAACGGSAASSAPADAGSGSGNGNGAAATADSGSGNGNGAAATADAGSGGGSATDAAAVGDQLKPPNATETSKTTTGNYWYAIYHSTDSADSLKGFYEGQIPKTGLKVISTTTANGSYVWVVATDDSGAFGGSVTVAPSTDGSGSDIIVGVGSN